MTSIPQKIIDGWDQLTQLATKLHLGDPLAPNNLPYVFRGHENAEWTLQPTLQRAVTRDGQLPFPETAELLEVEKLLTARFKAMAPTHLDPATLASTGANIDWWCVMRHHGVPTRILDWTASLYIAAYFACSRRPADQGSVYLLHVRALNDAMNAAHGDKANHAAHPDVAYAEPEAAPVVSIVARTTALTERMVVQQGAFLACRNVAANIEMEIATHLPTVVNGAQALLKLCIPATAKPQIMRHLAAMNVSANSLFPGLDGIGRNLEELVRYRPTPGG